MTHPNQHAPKSGEEEAAWLIEETWSGYLHYVHRDFDQVKWATECRKNEWRRSYGAPPKRVHQIITKNVDEAMRFPTKAAAATWLAFQPSWMSGPDDQYQIREHMWIGPPAAPLPASKSGDSGGWETYARKLRAALQDARGYVADALDAHEHMDGRLLLGCIDNLLPKPPVSQALGEDHCLSVAESARRGPVAPSDGEALQVDGGAS